ncbi:hypothetical protein EZV62_010820 [Acer yangbiense]|uniref:DUF659 domain-containing protein n=1 Tax=Acer yangbiense TaxID=1000413 RepID=A0A5C7I5K1_9ROSI|nr:hypothetical protein EZV62_010820 [Acer yangbiense]
MTQLERDEMINNCVTLNSKSKGGSNSDIVSQRGIRGLMDRYVLNVEEDEAKFFFENGIAYNITNSPSFINMCRSIGSDMCGLKPPTAYELRTSILKAKEANMQAIVAEVKKTWAQTGVSIMLDGWKDMGGRQLIHFLVNNLHGTIFLKSIDANDVVKDVTLLFKLLDEVVEEVGENIVVQVVTDNESN